MSSRNPKPEPRAKPPAGQAALLALANVGPATLRDFEVLGICSVTELAKQEPFALYRELCRITRTRHDPCVIDVFIAAISQAQGHEPRPWWHFTAERKTRLTKDRSLADVPLRDGARPAPRRS